MNRRPILILFLLAGAFTASWVLSGHASKDPSAILHQGASDVASAPTGYPMYIAGIDGVNLRGILTDSSGRINLGSSSVAAGTTLFDVGQSPPGAVSTGQTQITASTNGAGATALTATLTGAAAKFTYITGFEVTGAGATSVGIINITVTGTVTGTLNYNLVVPAGVSTTITPLVVQFVPPIQSSAVNTSIVVNVPSFGTGNTNSAVVAHGFTQ